MPETVLDYIWNGPPVTEERSLWLLSDEHLGSSDCALGHLKRTLQRIAEDKAHSRVVVIGDMVDIINVMDPRFDVRKIAADFVPNLDNLAKSVADYWLKIHEPIADQIIGVGTGNHEEKSRLRYSNDIANYIAMSLGVPYIQQIARARIFNRDNVHKLTVKGVLSHAEKGATTTGGKWAAVERMIGDHEDIDFFAQAHTHAYGVQSFIRNNVEGQPGHGRRAEKEVVAFLTGGYLKTYGEGYSGYGAKRGYAPCKLGTPRLKMRMVRTSMRGKSVDYKEVSGE